MPSTVVALGPHPDDVEAGCFGTLMKHVHAGDRVIVVVTTHGGYGNRSADTIRKEMARAEAILGIEYKVLENPIFEYQVNSKTIAELDSLFERERAEIVYSVWYGDSQDHQATFKNVVAASRKKYLRSLFCYEIPDYSYRSQVVFNARKYVDITPCIDQKLAAMSAYESYFSKQHLSAARGHAEFRGLACGVAYAEAFEIIFETWKDFPGEERDR